MALARINGRLKFFDCTELAITPVSNGRWSVKADCREFNVVGGRKSGGASHEWFMNFGDEWYPCNSMVRALELGIAM